MHSKSMLQLRSPRIVRETRRLRRRELLAGFLIAACRFIYLYAVRRLIAGEAADDVYPDYVAVVNVAFDMLAGAAAGAKARSHVTAEPA